jgi:hypothetical protein
MSKTHRKGNPVERYMNDFNRPRTHRDRKNDYTRRPKYGMKSIMRSW